MCQPSGHGQMPSEAMEVSDATKDAIPRRQQFPHTLAASVQNDLARMLQGQFIVVEGGDGCGKSTVLELLSVALKHLGLTVRIVREPGTTELGEQMREILQHKVFNPPICPAAEVFLFSAARAQLCHEVIIPALARGEVVLSSRFYPSTVAYQCGGKGLSWDAVIATQGELAIPHAAQPGLIFILDVPLHMAKERMARRTKVTGNLADNFEKLDDAFHKRVRFHYLELCTRDPLCKLIDASGTVQDTFDEVTATIIKAYTSIPQKGE